MDTARPVSTTETVPDSQTGQKPRRHDLDALRAFAMLLGIALHAALAFAPVPWIVMNKETVPWLGTVIEVIHGFRMPLFFLMSGFFSAMLVNRRGTRGYLGHRSKRIALPLFLGTLTIIPAMWGVIIGGHVLRAIVPAPEREWVAPDDEGAETVWSAAASGDLVAIQLMVQSGAPIDEPDPRLATLPLAWAATGDHGEVVEFLLDAGADPNQRMGDENTPLHTAFFFGAAESARLMLEAGADETLQNRYGEIPVGSMRHERGTVDFIAGILGVEADFETVQAGRLEIARVLEARQGEADSDPAPSSPIAVFLGAVSGDLFMHLWFLWHLCWLTCGLAVTILVLRLVPWLGAPGVLVATPVCLVVLVPLTALTQSWQANFGPDTSAGLIPAPHVLTHYAVFFGFGALMYATAGAVDRLGRAWWAHLAIAAVSCAVAIPLTHDAGVFAEQGIGAESGRHIGLVAQSLFFWTTCLGLMGLARTLLGKPSRRVRYISDASYWLYIAHLPVVVAGQFALAYLPLPPFVECVALLAITTCVLLLSYRWFVRPTWIGKLLNGDRRRLVKDLMGSGQAYGTPR